MLTERETVMGLRLLVTNAAAQLQRLCDELQVGADVHEQAETAKRACELADIASEESAPTLRKLARMPRKVGGK
jgi:hypothetical protein